MKEEMDKDMERLLFRYCDGTATLEEARRVEAWIGKAEANRKAAARMEALFLAADTACALKRVDTERALKRVRRRMKRRAVSWWTWTQRVAAVLTVPLLIGLLLQVADNRRQPETVRMVEVKTNPGMTASIVLPDSTVVHLNSESSLQYPSAFCGRTRRVALTGEAFFEVSEDPSRRFVVSTPHHARIEVYGTRFNVEAYQEDDAVCTTLVEGSIGFSFENEAGKVRELALTPHHKLVYLPRTGEVTVYPTDCEQETAWKEGKVLFENTPMRELLRRLGKRYNVEFVVTDPKLYGYAFTGCFTTQRLERILEYLMVSSRIRWRFVEGAGTADEKQRIEIY